jgi:hypothetical protein
MADNAECATAFNFFLEMFTQNNLFIPSCLEYAALYESNWALLRA